MNGLTMRTEGPVRANFWINDDFQTGDFQVIDGIISDVILGDSLLRDCDAFITYGKHFVNISQKHESLELNGLRIAAWFSHVRRRRSFMI